MVKSIVGWFRGLFTSRTKAQGLSNEPTHSQVERLIAAAGGASAQGGSLYSKPTYSQFERLIAALGGGSGSGSGSGSGLPAKRDKLDLGVYDFLPESWEVSGSKALFSGGTYTWDDASSQWRLSNGQRAIRAKAGAPNTYQLVFDPGTAGELAVCEWEGTAVQDVPFTHNGESWAVTVEGRGNAGLKPTGDTLVKKSEVPVVAGFVDGAGYSADYQGKPSILLKHGDNVVATVDASAFVVDGMVEDVYIGDATSGPEGTQDEDESGKLVIKFNTDAGNKVIRLSLTDIFNPENYPTKSYVDTTFVEKGATNVLIGSGASKANNVTNAVVIGVNASANGSTTSSAVAIGTEAKAKKTGAIQLGAGENSEEKSLQFRGTKVVGGDGKIPTSSLRDFLALESVPDRVIAASTAYVVGDVLGDSGKAYRCKKAYTSAETPSDVVAPSADTEHWTEVPVLSDKESTVENITGLSVFSDTVTYNVNAPVVYDGKIWICKAKHNAGAWNEAHFALSRVLVNKAAQPSNNVAVGSSTIANSNNSVAIGWAYCGGNGNVAIGNGAKVETYGSVQLGTGTNSTPKSLQFRGFQLAVETKENGVTKCKIPNERLNVDKTLSLEDAPADAKTIGTVLKGKINSSVFAPDFDAGVAYEANTHVTSNGCVYKCKVAVDAPEQGESNPLPKDDIWDSEHTENHWIEVDVGDLFANNKVTSLTSESTDEQYPSAKCVYDALNGAGSKPTRLYNENGADALDDKGQLFDSVVETGGHWEVDVVDNMGYNTGHYVYTYVGIVNGMHRWSQGGSTSATDRNIQISGDQVSWYSQFRFKQKVTSGVDPTSTSGSESMAGTYTGSDSRHSVTAVYVPQRPQIQSDPYAHFALESLPDRTWVAGKWAVGDLVKHDGKAYRCKAAAKLSDTTVPSSDTTHWTEVPVLTGVTQLFAGRSLPQAPTQNEVAEVVKEIFHALGGTISTTSSNDDNP